MGPCERDCAMPTPPPPIPYGWSDFALMRRERSLYVDKTRFLRELESERYAFLIRPRRFGKSLWVSVLENYYDRGRKERFEALFAGTDIGREPTANRSRYVILRFDFSAFDDALETLQERFQTYCHTKLRGALERNEDLIPADLHHRFLEPPTIDGKLNELFDYAGNHGIPLYVLIDEYDNFANTVLAHRGAEAYQSLFMRGESPRAPRLKAPTYGSGFYRSFFATLKAGTAGGAVERLFVTGVSPITMDDVTSGFNIAANISLDSRFNEMLGFTEGEVRGILETYRENGAFNRDQALSVMAEWYNGYRFSKVAEKDLHNTDMVLYYVKALVNSGEGPGELIDRNVRIDYGKLRHLLTVNRQLNGNFDLLRHVIGEGTADSEVSSGFPLERLNQRENFLSLLHFFGLLSIRGLRGGRPQLGIPNQTVRRLMHSYLRDAYATATSSS
ncbi:MAG: AAA family ATPase [Gammaproteobacteria bacterium]|nr:AAA family ATPase [Gammaproteobacteria bacterium]MYK81820.1 AAA family ATPase [Gammaproteobacteria bacterium]